MKKKPLKYALKGVPWLPLLKPTSSFKRFYDFNYKNGEKR
jgi:hypothetical protein